jgi:hypothetical protein
MLPKFLFPTYKQYKEDTQSIANWLAETARSYGYDTAEQTPREKSKSTSKPKTRRQVHEQYIPRVKDYLILANYIASHLKQPTLVPPAFLNTVQRVIAARKKSNDYFRNVLKDVGDTNGHTYFIGILEEVVTILKPHSSESPKMDVGEVEAKEIPSLENKFETLDIEEPSDEFLNAPAIPAEAGTPTIKYEAEPMKGKAELCFAAFTLLSDVNQILEYLQGLWSSFKAGEVDLITASVASNSAIDLVRRMEEELTQDFPDAQNTEKIINLLYQLRCTMLSQPPGANPQHRHLAPFNLDMYDEAQWLFLPTLTLLSSFSNVVKHNSIPISKPGYYGKYEPLSDRTKKSNAEKFLEDKVVLIEVLADFCFLGKMTRNIPAEDELTRGVRIMVTTGKLSLWLVFAAHLFLELHHILRAEIHKPFDQLQSLGSAATKTFLESIKYRKGLQLVNWPPENDRVIAEKVLRKITDWIMKDQVQTTMRKMVGNDLPLPNEFNLLRQHPLLCGLFAFSIQLEMQEFGVTFVNAWGSAMYSAHLYNAVKQEGFCAGYWHDMELLIDMQTPERIFVGGRPKNIDDYLKRFCLSMGYASEQYASNRRNQGPVVSKKGPRGLTEICPVSQCLKRRYCENEALQDYSLETIEVLLNDGFIGEKQDQEDVTFPEITIGMGSAIVALRRREKSAVRNHFKQTARLSPLELLLALQLSIADEAPLLQFDYFAFHRICWSVLRTVQQALHPKLLQYYGPGYLESENQLPFVVGFIFMTASQSQSAAKILGHRMKKGVQISSKLLHEAGIELNRMLEDEQWKRGFSEQVSKIHRSEG